MDDVNLDKSTEVAAKKLAAELLAAQVEEARQRLLSSNYLELAAAELDFFLAEASEISLGEVVSRQAVKDVVRVFAFDLDLGAGVIALSGDIAQQLHKEAQKNAPKLKALLSNNDAAQWFDKIIELHNFRALVLDKISQSGTLHDFIADHVLILIEQQIAQRSPNWLANLTSSTPSESNTQSRLGNLKNNVQRKISSTVRSQEEVLEKTLRQSVAKTIQKVCKDVALLDDDIWKDALWQLWQVIRDEYISEFTKGLDPLDIEDFLVLGYDQWRKVRQTEYIQRLILTGVDVFFDAYQETPLLDLLDEVGITRTHMLAEVVRFAPQVIQILDERGYIRAILTRQLKPFYENEATLKIMESALGRG